MSKKVLLVTGAASGMGRLSLERALASGWKVCALDRQGLEPLPAHPDLLCIQADVCDAQAIEAAVDRTERELGPIDRVSNAAAIMPLGLLLEQDRELIKRIMDINYGGLVNLAAATLPRMLARGRGQFLSFGSIAGHMPTIYMGAYNASKFAVVSYTEVLYHENRGRGVQFVLVCPPAVATPLLKQARDTVWPRMLDQVPPLAPEKVLDRIERAFQCEEFMVFPGPVTRFTYWLRRMAPNLIWKRVHQVEGR
ncbi:SDR family NAD(P)-dependent oxidoreductase [Solimonas aquatica]|uniref:SDR family NAD(P)-dependent oxidoreductase n=1 Tax=Solimonas aquatica TaxID=489703 RepID=UPI0015A68449|nr:SDR family oxidoreductase [Solimonas aquatica]